MNKYTFSMLFVFLFPLFAFATIDKNLQYGMRNSEVTELQEFLIDQGYLKGSATGNFFTLTLNAVKLYQEDNSLPTTGYVGILTRGLINKSITDTLAESNAQAIEETGTNYVPTQPNVPIEAYLLKMKQDATKVNDYYNSLQKPGSSLPSPTVAKCEEDPQLNLESIQTGANVEIKGSYTTGCVIDPQTSETIIIQSNGSVNKYTGTLEKPNWAGFDISIRTDGTSWSDTYKSYMSYILATKWNNLNTNYDTMITFLVGSRERTFYFPAAVKN